MTAPYGFVVEEDDKDDEPDKDEPEENRPDLDEFTSDNGGNTEGGDSEDASATQDAAYLAAETARIKSLYDRVRRSFKMDCIPKRGKGGSDLSYIRVSVPYRIQRGHGSGRRGIRFPSAIKDSRFGTRDNARRVVSRVLEHALDTCSTIENFCEMFNASIGASDVKQLPFYIMVVKEITTPGSVLGTGGGDGEINVADEGDAGNEADEADEDGEDKGAGDEDEDGEDKVAGDEDEDEDGEDKGAVGEEVHVEDEHVGEEDALTQLYVRPAEE